MAATRQLRWSHIDTVFLDMDGTLLDLHFDDHFWQHFLPRRYGENQGLSLAEARRRLEPQFAAKQGSLDWYCLDYWSRELGLDIPALKQELAHLITIHDGVLDFLTAARRDGKQLWLVTNAHGKALTLKLRHTGLSGHFDRIVCAHDLGLPKEEPTFWRRLNEQASYDPERTLFIDDNETVLASARRHGIAWLLGIARPSSQKPARTAKHFPLLRHFHQLLDESRQHLADPDIPF